MAHEEHRSSKRYPELQRFDSKEDAQAALKAWQKKLMKSPRFWLGLVAYTIAVGLFVTLIFVSIRQWFRIPMRLIGPVVGGVTGGTGMLGVTWFWWHQCRRYLRERLIARGVPICLKCGYDLRGQVEPRCPECGTPCNAELIAAGAGSGGAVQQARHRGS